MKKLSLLMSTGMILILTMFISCNSQSLKSDNESASAIQQDGDKTVTVYYFHGERRCATCKAVGKVSKNTVGEVFENNPGVVFKDLNIDEPENNELKERFELSGSGLFVFDGNKKVDLTAFAFQKALESPKELSEKLILTVNDLL